ncbi:MAG: S-methyl-5-thioribose-1-phosphate isomerase [Euryarchaeota archaeon]|nr:S-methyl-5-thioribose-1-phosphate isomerase [Euryarchaeota archaeon]
MRTLEWDSSGPGLRLIDQTRLPGEEAWLTLTRLDEVVEAIRTLRVRGAPALEAAGAYGVAVAARELRGARDFRRKLEEAAGELRTVRPTAVNLSRGVDRALEAALRGVSPRESFDLALGEAHRVADEDVRRNLAMGGHGAALLRDGDTVMTYCNAGRLATVDYGTALGVLRAAASRGKRLRVVACETRPLNQGARLTSWELSRDEFDVTLIPDNAAAHLIRKGGVDRIVVGADRITRDAVFNKIGTYMVSLAARAHHVPFYVAAPVSTFDLEHRERDITIEERSPDELRWLGGRRNAPDEVRVYNPAFDATPLSHVSALITERGVLRPPYSRSLRKIQAGSQGRRE